MFIRVSLEVEPWTAGSTSASTTSLVSLDDTKATSPSHSQESPHSSSNSGPVHASELTPELTTKNIGGNDDDGRIGGRGEAPSNSSSQSQSSEVVAISSLAKGAKVQSTSFKVGWFEGTDSIDVKVGVRDAAERHLGVQGIEWRLVGEVRATGVVEGWSWGGVTIADKTPRSLSSLHPRAMKTWSCPRSSLRAPTGFSGGEGAARRSGTG